MKKETIIQTALAIIAIAGFIIGIYFIVRLVNGPGDKKEQAPFDYAQGKKTYTHPDYGFTFNYPANFKLGKFQEGAGEVILVQAKTSPQPSPSQGEGAQAGFQIFVSLYEEKNPLSKAIIQESAPDMKISNDKEIEIGAKLREQEDRSLAPAEENIKALSFDTSDTHEIWFVQDGNLYQITSFKDFGGRMEEIIKSLRFN